MTQVGPLLRIDSTLHLAWGLTLYLSNDDKQVGLASAIKSSLFDSLKINPVQQANPPAIPPAANPLDPNDVTYVNNLVAVISSYLRQMGFEKDEYDSHLNAQKDRLCRATTYWQDLGTMTSFSTESAITKVMTFLGVGAGTDYLSKIIPLFQTKGNATSFSTYDIVLILIVGSLGVVASIAFLKWFGTWRINKLEDAVKKEQDNWWRKKMRPRYKQLLIRLCIDIVTLVERFYPDYKDELLLQDKNAMEHKTSKNVDAIIENILPNELLYEKPK